MKFWYIKPYEKWKMIFAYLPHFCVQCRYYFWREYMYRQNICLGSGTSYEHLCFDCYQGNIN